MLNAIAATCVIFLILVLSELLWRKAYIRGEFARKFVHILAGSFIAFLPFIISYNLLTLLAVGFIIANLLNRYTTLFKLFHAIHTITRKSWGDLLFGLGILCAALLRPSKWLFVGAILQVALADGLAAVIGTRAKKKYIIFDHAKSITGTSTFFVVSVLIVLFIVSLGHLTGYNFFALFLIIPLTMTLLENVSGYGSDNIVLPLGFLLMMRILHVA
jgi:dolichol kinase